jgi:hypothetical protein
MNNLFLILVLVSFVALVIGLIKPTLLKQTSRRRSLLIFGGSTILFFVLFGVTSTPSNIKEEVRQEKVSDTNNSSETVKDVAKEKQNNVESSQNNQVKQVVQPTVNTEAKPVVVNSGLNTDRVSVLATVKTNASSKWSDNYSMVKYEIDRQMEAYDWLIKQTKYPEIMKKAVIKWEDNYTMIKYEYERQVKAYESI